MSDFCKIVIASDGAQVLVMKTMDDEQNPALRVITQYGGAEAAFTISFAGDDLADWVRAKAFSNFDTDAADNFRP